MQSVKRITAVTDPLTTQEYIFERNQYTYRSQGVDIADKHVEIIASRMISKIRIVEPGDTNFVSGALISLHDYTEGNKMLLSKVRNQQLVNQYC